MPVVHIPRAFHRADVAHRRACAPHPVTRLVPQPAACKEPGNVVEGGAVARLAQVAREVRRHLPAITQLELPVDLDKPSGTGDLPTEKAAQVQALAP